MSAVLRSHYPRTRFSRAAELAGIATKESVVANRIAPILNQLEFCGPTCRNPMLMTPRQHFATEFIFARLGQFHAPAGILLMKAAQDFPVQRILALANHPDASVTGESVRGEGK